MNEVNAKKLLFAVADVLEDIGVEFFLNAGTLLGAIRERKFIETDRNVDLAMLQENLIPIAKELESRLIKKGITVQIIDHRHNKPWNGSVYAIKFRGYGEHGELPAFMKIKGKRAIPSHLGDHWFVFTARFFEELDEIEFYGRTFKIPKDVNGFLTESYGDWRTSTKLSNIIYPCKKPDSWKDDIIAGEK